MSQCIFCQIVKGKIPSVKVWEDKNFLAILDTFPNTKGMTLVMPKKHYSSDVFEMSDQVYKEFMMTGKKVALLLNKKLNVKRTALIMEGLGVDHVHLKLYPLHGLNEKFKKMEVKEDVFFDEYPGYVTTKLGPKADPKELEKIAAKIRE